MKKWLVPGALLFAAPAWAQTGDVAVVLAFAPYAHALAAMAGWGILMIVLSFLSIFGAPRGRTPSGMPVRDYSDPFYRRDRAFRNAVETAGLFLAVTLAAILVGAAPFWVNLFASVFLAARIAMAAIHIGTEIQPLRSVCWLTGTVCCLALGIMALFGAFAL
ncbi:MAG: MAPEG family protein [Jannaschia sp.]